MATKGDTPYSTNFISGDIDRNNDPSQWMKKYKKEERETHTGPNTLPYEMANLPQQFGAMVDNGMQASKTIEDLLKTKNVEHKKALLKLKRNTEKIVMYLIQNVDSVLEKYTIGAKHAIDDIEQADMDEELYQ
jgi:hypothetical protein